MSDKDRPNRNKSGNGRQGRPRETPYDPMDNIEYNFNPVERKLEFKDVEQKVALNNPALDTPALDTPALNNPALDTPALDTPALNSTVLYTHTHVEPLPTLEDLANIVELFRRVAPREATNTQASLDRSRELIRQSEELRQNAALSSTRTAEMIARSQEIIRQSADEERYPLMLTISLEHKDILDSQENSYSDNSGDNNSDDDPDQYDVPREDPSHEVNQDNHHEEKVPPSRSASGFFDSLGNLARRLFTPPELQTSETKEEKVAHKQSDPLMASIVQRSAPFIINYYQFLDQSSLLSDEAKHELLSEMGIYILSSLHSLPHIMTQTIDNMINSRRQDIFQRLTRLIYNLRSPVTEVTILETQSKYGLEHIVDIVSYINCTEVPEYHVQHLLKLVHFMYSCNEHDFNIVDKQDIKYNKLDIRMYTMDDISYINNFLLYYKTTSTNVQQICKGCVLERAIQRTQRLRRQSDIYETALYKDEDFANIYYMIVLPKQSPHDRFELIINLVTKALRSSDKDKQVLILKHLNVLMEFLAINAEQLSIIGLTRIDYKIIGSSADIKTVMQLDSPLVVPVLHEDIYAALFLIQSPHVKLGVRYAAMQTLIASGVRYIQKFVNQLQMDDLDWVTHHDDQFTQLNKVYDSITMENKCTDDCKVDPYSPLGTTPSHIVHLTYDPASCVLTNIPGKHQNKPFFIHMTIQNQLAKGDSLLSFAIDHMFTHAIRDGLLEEEVFPLVYNAIDCDFETITPTYRLMNNKKYDTCILDDQHRTLFLKRLTSLGYIFGYCMMNNLPSPIALSNYIVRACIEQKGYKEFTGHRYRQMTLMVCGEDCDETEPIKDESVSTMINDLFDKHNPSIACMIAFIQGFHMIWDKPFFEQAKQDETTQGLNTLCAYLSHYSQLSFAYHAQTFTNAELFEQIITSDVWTDTDRQRLKEFIMGLTDEQRITLVKFATNQKTKPTANKKIQFTIHPSRKSRIPGAQTCYHQIIIKDTTQLQKDFYYIFNYDSDFCMI